ncbi:MAG: class II aldolase/adducin family protein [Bacteroidetes bacterium]|nr:MAG: class II aldolase/adducin family protein [Bacteroidota bacterium]
MDEESFIINNLKDEVAYYMRRLYERGLTTTSGGNISVRGNGMVFITPSQTDKGRMKGYEICMLDSEGEPIEPNVKLSMETAMHLAIYAARPDVKAIVHAHPPTATAFAVAHTPINTRITGESWAILGEPAFAEYELMGTEELAKAVANATLSADVVLLKNHGILAVGKTLLEAFDRVEVLENCAKIMLLSQLAGGAKTLGQTEIEAINKLINR